MSRPQLIARPSSILSSQKTIVLVTGGNTGIGFEIVKALATSQPNYQILLGCRDTAKGEAAVSSMGAPLNVNPIQLDINSDGSIEMCAKTIEQMFGRLDILINNAGTAGRDLEQQGIPRASRKGWEHVMNVNVVSTGVLTEALIPLLEKSKLPKIIFITSKLGSVQSLFDGYPLQAGIPFYLASKSAVNMLTAFYATKYPKFKVNACCPGYRSTGLNNAPQSPETDPKLGAVNALRLATEGPDGATGTYTDSDGPIPW